MARKPHDELFTYTFTEVAQAGSLFSSVLSPELVRLLDWSTLRGASEKSTNEKLNNRFTDLRYVVNTADTGEPVWVNLILEHQSSPDARMAWRLWRYQNRVIERYFRDHPKATTAPPVLTVVVYNGATRWNHPLRLRSYFAGSEALLTAMGSKLLDFEYTLVDLCRIPDRNLKGLSLTVLTLMMLKYASEGQLWERLAGLTQVVRQVYRDSGLGAIGAVFNYAGYNQSGPPPSPVMTMLDQAVGPDKKERIMLSWGEKVELRGEKRGEKRGELRGIQLGERRLLKRVLLKKFGALPATIDEQLEALSTEQLEAAIVHVFGAASVQAVLDAVH